MNELWPFTFERVCIADCIRPCLNGGTCNFGACVCPTGYEGVACELESECEPNIYW